MKRRDVLKLMAAAPFIGVLDWSPEEVSGAALKVEALGGAALEPQFFTAHEWRTLHALVDLIIPADGKSGSATDAGVPEFMDFMLNEASDSRQRAMHEGFVWLDEETRRRHDVTFADATDAQRRSILDDIAWPARAPEQLSAGVAFFNSVRDLTAAGFFSSRMGYDDLEFRGNEFVVEWQGCPPAALEKLGVSYDLMEKRP
ncbi:MAG TPA: gluconate 2-dehydrogenase subunit 3 family protein [Longimicrobiales bacterium]